MAAYNRLPKVVYNEFDKSAAAWLRELIRRDLIAPGDVDERSIEDVRPDDLRGYTQCHFFAGIGVWSYALRLAGWPDDRPVWTGSPPCQPFSAAGKGLGTADERHLWPAFFHLIDVCRPDTFFGEQVASKDALAWVEHVSADVEGAGYAFGAFDLCAAGFGAPHIRQRLKFVGTRSLADALGPRLEGHRRHGGHRDQSGRLGAVQGRSVAAPGLDGGVSLPDDAFWRTNLSRGDHDDRADAGRPEGSSHAGTGCPGGGMADGARSGWREERQDGGGSSVGDRAEGFAAGSSSSSSDLGMADCAGVGLEGGRFGSLREPERSAALWGRTCDDSLAVGMADASNGDRWSRECREEEGTGSDEFRRRGLASGGADLGRPGPTNSLWGDADWLLCRDGKWRPVEPGTFPLAHGAAARVGRLRGYGNAIVAPAAAHFISCFLEAESEGFAGERQPVDSVALDLGSLTIEGLLA